jgi:hypothetical protein
MTVPPTRHIESVSAVSGTFAVRSINLCKVGCSPGPLANYVGVNFTGTSAPCLPSPTNGRTLPHELGHACNLLHVDDPNNLMTPGSNTILVCYAPRDISIAPNSPFERRRIGRSAAAASCRKP